TRGLLLGHPRREAGERHAIAAHDLGPGDALQHLPLAAGEMGPVVEAVGGVQLELAPGDLWAGARNALRAARVGGERRVRELDDVRVVSGPGDTRGDEQRGRHRACERGGARGAAAWTTGHG